MDSSLGNVLVGNGMWTYKSDESDYNFDRHSSKRNGRKAVMSIK